MSTFECSAGVLLIEDPADFAVLAMASEFVPDATVNIRREQDPDSQADLALWYARRAVDPNRTSRFDVEWLSNSVHRALRAGGAVISITDHTSSVGAGKLVARYEELRAMRETVGFWAERIEQAYYDNAP